MGEPAPSAALRSRPQRPEELLANQADSIAGEIFGVPVSMGNCAFAKRVAFMLPRPWGVADLPAAERERVVWENLMYEDQPMQDSPLLRTIW